MRQLLFLILYLPVFFTYAHEDIDGKWQLTTSAHHGIFLVHSVTGRIYIIDAESKTPTATPVNFIENAEGVAMGEGKFTPLYKKPHKFGFDSEKIPKSHR